MKLPIVFDSSNIWHRNILYHPEQPARIETCIKKIQEIPGILLSDVTPDPTTQTNADITMAPFSDEELNHARYILQKTHALDMIENLELSCLESRKRRLEEERTPLGFIGNIDDDTYVTTETFDICLRATAAWIRAVDSAIDSGNDSGAAMALTRPPGHHATYETANGFCLVNFAAAAAIHAMERDPNLKISILDWDVHYGQGVAQIIGKYKRARYVSIHQAPAFPYLGGKFGISGEYNNTMTIPITADTTWSLSYCEKFENHALQFVMSENWHPDIVLICAGYDALDSDELASVSLVAKDYAEMVRMLKRHLKSLNGDKVVPIALGLEGGYQLSEMAGGGNLGDAVAATIRALLHDDSRKKPSETWLDEMDA